MRASISSECVQWGLPHAALLWAAITAAVAAAPVLLNSSWSYSMHLLLRLLLLHLLKPLHSRLLAACQEVQLCCSHALQHTAAATTAAATTAPQHSVATTTATAAATTAASACMQAPPG